MNRLAVLAVLVLVACGGTPAAPATPTQPAAATPTAQAPPTSPDPAQTPATPTDQPTPAQPGTTPMATTGTVVSPPAGGEVDVTRLATGVTPPGWVEVRSADEACRIAVPADWTTDILPGTGSSPGFEAQATVGHDQFSAFGGDWPAYVELIRNTYVAEEIVLHSSEETFLMRSPETLAEVTYRALRRRAASSCTLLATVRGHGMDQYHATMVQVLDTLAEVP